MHRHPGDWCICSDCCVSHRPKFNKSAGYTVVVYSYRHRDCLKPISPTRRCTTDTRPSKAGMRSSLRFQLWLIHFHPNVTTQRSGLCYRKSVCRQSVVYNVRVPYSGGWNFRQYFFAISYFSQPLTSVQNFTEIVQGEPLRWGVKRKRGSKTERRRVRVNHILIEFLVCFWQVVCVYIKLRWNILPSIHEQFFTVKRCKNYYLVLLSYQEYIATVLGYRQRDSVYSAGLHNVLLHSQASR